MSIRDFGVSMSASTLQHKLKDGRIKDGNYAYWTFPKGLPEGIEEGSKMWVANGGEWVGYFIIHDQLDANPNEACFFSESFVSAHCGPRSAFRGYTWNVPEGCE